MIAELPKHYNGWQLVEELWFQMSPLPKSNPGVESLRCFAMKHIVRLEGKGDSAEEVQKAINYAAKLSESYGEPESPLVNPSVELPKIKEFLANSPRGLDLDTEIDQLRLVIVVNLANACRLPMVLEDLKSLKECYEHLV